MIQSYKDLIVWQKAMQMTEMVYSMVKKLPKEETYALSDQMRRAAVPIPSNIAKGSGYELETQMILTIRIGYVTEQEILPIMNLLTEIGKIINSMISKLKTNP